MKKALFLLGASLFLAAGSSSCSKNDPVIFDDAFVYLADANGASASAVDWDSQNYLATYYVYLVSPAISGDVQVTYDLVVGSGLAEGVDFKTVPSTASPITFTKGIYTMPIRIEWLKHELDATKDNTVRIVLRSCSDPSVQIGRPGPDRLGAEYTITKR